MNRTENRFELLQRATAEAHIMLDAVKALSEDEYKALRKLDWSLAIIEKARRLLREAAEEFDSEIDVLDNPDDQ